MAFVTDPNEVLEMEVFTVINITADTTMQRIPGGWIHTTLLNGTPVTSVFVPAESMHRDRMRVRRPPPPNA